MTADLTSSAWTTLLGTIVLDPGVALLYLDPDLLDSGLVVAATHQVEDRWQLRRLVERKLRTMSPTDPAVVVHVGIPGVRSTSDLPFDYMQFPVRSLDLRLPRNALEDIGALTARHIEVLVGPGPLHERAAALAREITGLHWPPAPESALVSVLRLLPVLGPGLRCVLAETCTEPVPQQILAADDPTEMLQSLLDRWASDSGWEAHKHLLAFAANDLATLVRHSGLRKPVGLDVEHLPAEFRRALNESDAVPGIRRALAAVVPPTVDGLGDADQYKAWVRVADDWARCRWLLAGRPPTAETRELAEEVWARWAELDAEWRPWLQDHYGRLLGRPARRVASVHKIPQFLADNVVYGGGRFALLVLDGLGLAQWQHILKHLGVEPIEDRRLVACAPSVTSISRQAIFAGKLPVAFSASIDTTSREESHWTAFWSTYWADSRAGTPPALSHWQRSDGNDSSQWFDLPTGVVAYGLVANAVDTMMHGSTGNVDHTFYATLQAWLNGGFLDAALDWAREEGVQLWITADHGNLPCVELDEPLRLEGTRVGTRSSTRAWLYRSEEQRATAKNPGLAWNPDGFPTSEGFPFFANGRTYFSKDGNVVTHGGPSIDEMLVPLARLI